MPDAPIRGQGVTVSRLFFHHTFRLDYYQREYSWTRADVTALLSDLRRRFTENWKPLHEREHVRTYSPYYLGSIVYYEGEDDDATYLVDGQQRVTTLFLLLVHLRRLREEFETRQQQLGAIFREYLAGQDPFPERVHINVLCYRLIWDYAETAASWAAWAIDEVERWPPDVTAPKDRQKLMDVLQQALADTSAPT